jgi:hypothetical protein
VNFREQDRTDFDQTREAVRRLKQEDCRLRMGIVFMFGWLFGVIMICAYLGVQPLW